MKEQSFDQQQFVLLGFPLRNRLLAAPMAGVSSRVFRDIVREKGAGAAYGEMVSAQALCYHNRRTYELLDLAGEEHPRIVQLSGSQPCYIGEAAKIAVSLGADMIDLNMGCPVNKVVRNGEGAALMRDAALAARLVQAARAAGKPVSVKFRLGWDDTTHNAVDFGRQMEAAGAALLTVHGRTRQQLYAGAADWHEIGELVQAVRIPVVGNGDIKDGESAQRLLRETGCAAVMIGRAMLGNPWIFAEIESVLAKKTPQAKPGVAEIVATALQHLQRQTQRSIYWLSWREHQDPAKVAPLAEQLAVKSLRSHLGWYLKGLPRAAALRHQINQLTSVAAIEALLQGYLCS